MAPTSLVTTDDSQSQPQTVPAYLPNGDFFGFLSPSGYQMYMQQMARQNGGGGGGGGGNSTANMLVLGSDTALAGYQLFTIGQLDSDFASAKQARHKRFLRKQKLLDSATGVDKTLGSSLSSFLAADDELSFYQNRVIDGQLKGFWASALAAGGRALGDYIGTQSQGSGDSSVSGWIMAAGGAFLLATLFDNRHSNSNGSGRGNNASGGYQE